MQFDQQADIYDERTGLGEQTAKNIALSLNQLISPFQQGVFLEIGAGTGEIGYFLQDFDIPYIGIDLSAGMLEMYRKRYSHPLAVPQLIQTDGNQAWPVKENSVSVFFSSRAMHQLDLQHTLNQLQSLAHPDGSILVLGNVKRNKNSVKAVMRQEMHKLLKQFGMKEKSGQSNRKQLFDAIEQQGGEKQLAVSCSHWQVDHAPIDSINSWKTVEGIAGQTLDPALKEQILETLILSAGKKFTDLNQALEAEESYELNAIKLPYN